MTSNPAGTPKTTEPVRIIPPKSKPEGELYFNMINNSGSGKTSSCAPSPIKDQPRILFCPSNRFSLDQIKGNTIMRESRNMIYGSAWNGSSMVKMTRIMTIPMVREKPNAIAVIVFFVIFM